MTKTEFMKLFWDILESDPIRRGMYSKTEWTQLIDAFMDYTPTFIDNLFEDINVQDYIAVNDQIEEFIDELLDYNAGIDFLNNPPFSTAFFSQYLTRPNDIIHQQRPMTRERTPQPVTKPPVSEPTPQVLKQVVEQPVVKTQPKVEPTEKLPELELSSLEPQIKTDPIPIPVPEVTPTVNDLIQTESEPIVEDPMVDEPIEDSLAVRTPGEDLIAAARMESTDAYAERKAIEEQNRINHNFEDFEKLYRHQMLFIMTSHNELAKQKIFIYGMALTDFKLDEIRDEFRIGVVDGFLDEYDRKIDTGEFDPGDYLTWSDLDGQMIDNPETFPILIKSDLTRIAKFIYNSTTT